MIISMLDILESSQKIDIEGRGLSSTYSNLLINSCNPQRISMKSKMQIPASLERFQSSYFRNASGRL
jgi:Mg-chelatase subunit ChlI